MAAEVDEPQAHRTSVEQGGVLLPQREVLQPFPELLGGALLAALLVVLLGLVLTGCTQTDTDGPTNLDPC